MKTLDAYDFDAALVARLFPSRHPGESRDPGFQLQETNWAPASAGATNTPPIRNEIFLAGVDEVGRGPLAGPVVAAAVILPPDPRIDGLRDSKEVPPEQREALYCEIQEIALAVEVAVIEPNVIDEINILEASLLAMRRCVESLAVKPHLVIADGNKKPGTGILEQAIIKGDGLSAAIMAASIIAKVTRDDIMRELHDKYPVYGFNEHKGYGCEQHMEALRRHGPCPIHRRSFEPVKILV